MLRFALFFSVLFSANLPVYAFESVATFDKDKSAFKVLIFLSKDCPCSQSHVAHLNQMSEKFKSVVFYGVITDEFRADNKRSIDEYFSNKNFKFAIIEDKEQKLVKEYGALKTPHVSLLKLQPNDQYSRIYEGGVSDHRHFDQSKVAFLNASLIAATHDKPLPYSNGKSLGCYIRRL